MATTFTNGRFFDYRAVGRTPGAALYTYAAGTLTPLATYTDQGGGSSNTNPVICDVNGGADVWLGSSSYRFRLYTDTIGNGGTLIDDWDNITVADSSAVTTLESSLGDFSRTLSVARIDSGGGGGTDYDEASYVSRHNITTHAWYGFIDNSSVSYAGGAPIYGHASYNDNITFAGTVASDHHHSFQSYPHYGTAATIGELSSFWSQIDATAGTITEASGVKVNNPLGAGTITSMYGVLVKALTRGTSNWGVYVEGPTTSFFGGAVWLGSASGPQAFIEYNSTLGHVQVQPRAGYNFKIGAAGGDRKLRLGAPDSDAFDATIENRADGTLEIVPRSGFGIVINGTTEIGSTLVCTNAPVMFRSYTVATLPSAATYIYGRVFVTDANAVTFQSIVAGGGANKVPVFSDGTNWRIG